VNGSPGDQTAAYGLPAQVRAQMPEVLFGRLQPDAPENGLPAVLAGAASIENVRFVDLGANRLGMAGDIVFSAAAGAVAHAMLQSKSDGVPAPPPGVQEQNLQVGFGRWPVDGTLTLPPGNGPFPAVLVMRGETASDRDGTFQFDKPVRDYAWGLAARGIVVLRYDPRRWAYVIAMNKVNEPVDTQEDVLTDPISAVRTLRGLPRIRQDRIFVLGQGDAGACSTGGDRRGSDRGFDPNLLLTTEALGNNERCSPTPSFGSGRETGPEAEREATGRVRHTAQEQSCRPLDGGDWRSAGVVLAFLARV
jgi:hypothetical protein